MAEQERCADSKSRSARKSGRARVRSRAAGLVAFVVVLVGLLAYQAHVEAQGVKRSKGVKSAKKGLGKTWVKIGGKIYGAKPDARGPIGGGGRLGRVLTLRGGLARQPRHGVQEASDQV